MKKKWIMTATIIAIVVILGSLAGPIMSNVEQPEYTVVSSEQNIEVRQYEPMIIATVEVTGAREKAIGDGFRLLADYIFGNNTVQQAIAMTSPVQQQAGENISMTAPVQQQATVDAWKVSFVMPSKYSMETLPDPNNDRIKLEQTPAKKFVVIEFSGTHSKENIAEHEKQLMNYISAQKLPITGTPKYAFYNPPWTLPFMRRNEIMIEME